MIVFVIQVVLKLYCLTLLLESNTKEYKGFFINSLSGTQIMHLEVFETCFFIPLLPLFTNCSSLEVIS